MDVSIPIVVGTVVTVLIVSFVVAKLKHQNQDDGSRRPPETSQRATRRSAPRPQNSPDPTLGSFANLQAMFPNVPEDLIRNELRRADSTNAAIDRLLALSMQLPSIPSTNPRIADSKARVSAETHAALLEEIRTEPHAPIGDSPASKSKLKADKIVWETDRQSRQELLNNRKREMLLQARQTFLAKSDSS